MTNHYTVVLNYKRNNGSRGQKTYPIDAATASEAKSAAKSRLKGEYPDCVEVSVADCKQR